jgi:hypothetical protein
MGVKKNSDVVGKKKWREKMAGKFWREKTRAFALHHLAID